jgi:hypothetical protein
VPPRAMPVWRDGRPLKRWRYVGAYGPELMVCVGDAHIGPLRQRFWAVTTSDGRLREKTALFGSGGLRMSGPQIAVDAPGLRLRLTVHETEGVETLSRHGNSYIWTRKQGGVEVNGIVELDGTPIQFSERGIVDESAGYHARHTVWSWSAGVGRLNDGRQLAWNLANGVHDAPRNSERTLWIEGEPSELEQVNFSDDLTSVQGSGTALTFAAWSERSDNTNALLLKSKYRQPFGTFKGTLGGHELADGYGVTEHHDVHW